MTYVTIGNAFAVSVIFIVLDVLAVGGRFVSRLSRSLKIATDDWLCIPALILTVCCGSILIYGSSKKVMGSHSVAPTTMEEADSATQSVAMMSKLFLTFSIFSIPAIGLIKLSFLFCYRRIFKMSALFSYLNWALISAVIAWTIAFTIATIAACGKHVELLWQENGSGKCINTWDLSLILTITDFAIDLLVMVMPLPWIWRLNMTLTRRVAVTGVFLTGSIATIAAAIRMAVMIEMYSFTFDAQTSPFIFGMPAGGDNMDMLGIISFYLYFSYIEIGIGMFVCCLPCLRLLFEDLSLGRVISNAYANIRSRVTTSAMSSGRRHSSRAKHIRLSSMSSKPSPIKSFFGTPKPSSEATFEGQAMPASPYRLPTVRSKSIGIRQDVDVYSEQV